MTIHVVGPGESVDSIAAEYGVDPFRLAADNEAPADGALAVGQTLIVRFPRRIHAVRPGETLHSIAEAYGVSVRTLYQNNWALGGLPALEPGQELVISYQEQPIGSAAFNGYAYPFLDQTVLDAATPYLTDLTPFTYGIGADGRLVPLRDEGILAAAGQYGVQPWMHLSSLTEEGRFSSARAETLLQSGPQQEALLETCPLCQDMWRAHIGAKDWAVSSGAKEA